MSKQIGQVNSLWRLRAETAISVSSVMASCGVRWSSYKERSHDRSTGSLAVIIFKFLLWFHEFPKIFPKTLISLFRTSYLAFFQSAFNFSYDFLETYLNLNDRSTRSLVVIIETKFRNPCCSFTNFLRFFTYRCFLDLIGFSSLFFFFLFSSFCDAQSPGVTQWLQAKIVKILVKQSSVTKHNIFFHISQ